MLLAELLRPGNIKFRILELALSPVGVSSSAGLITSRIVLAKARLREMAELNRYGTKVSLVFKRGMLISAWERGLRKPRDVIVTVFAAGKLNFLVKAYDIFEGDEYCGFLHSGRRGQGRNALQAPGMVGSNLRALEGTF